MQTILLGFRRGGAKGQRVNSTCNLLHISVGRINARMVSSLSTTRLARCLCDQHPSDMIEKSFWKAKCIDKSWKINPLILLDLWFLHLLHENLLCEVLPLFYSECRKRREGCEEEKACERVCLYAICSYCLGRILSHYGKGQNKEKE